MQILVLGGVFIGTLVLMVGLYVFVNRRRFAAAEAARARLENGDDRAAVVLPGILKEDSVSESPLLNQLLLGRGWVADLERSLELAGTQIKPGRFLMTMAMLASVGLLLGMTWRGPAVGIAGLVVGAWSPVLWLKRKRKSRRDAFETQLPDAIDMLVNALKSGYSFQAAMRFVGDEMAAPLGPEFGRFYDQQRLGVEVRAALLALQDRMDSLDLKMFVTAVLIQRETGGTLSDVLLNIADLMRQRVAVRGQIETLTAEPKMSARVLASLPVVVYFGLAAVAPDFVEPLTTTTPGKAMLIFAAVSVLLGYFIMMQIADIDF
jgi:tight adherence protein B